MEGRERERRRTVREWLALHARPVRVRESTLPFTHTLGLGGMSMVLVFMAFHFWRVRKAGGVVDPEPAGPDGDEQPAYVSTLPHLLMRELAVGLALVAAVLVFSVLVDAPLGAPDR